MVANISPNQLLHQLKNSRRKYMKRWDFSQMLETGKKLFAKIHRRKYHAHHNSEIHYMAREMEEWLPKGIQALIDGMYDPRCLKRIYFPDEMVDQLHLSDRIFQHILLKMLKPTFKHIMNPNCYHLHGPSGVKYATQRIKEVLEKNQHHYVIRADIRSYYKSILHHRLIADIKKYYDDPKLIHMLENIITNPIDTPRGTKNPIHGVALRGPLSQFFSAIFLKPLDDAFDSADVVYLRYQDDILILCKTKRQMNRCRRRMMQVLQERRLTLSRKKSRIGSISNGFHFLGIHYPGTQTRDSNTNVLHRWTTWWRATTSETWQYPELLQWFIDACWDIQPAAYAAGLINHHFTKLHTATSSPLDAAA